MTKTKKNNYMLIRFKRNTKNTQENSIHMLSKSKILVIINKIINIYNF